MKARNTFLEQLQRRRERAASEATGEATTPEKAIEAMSDAELDEALTATKRELLDLRHAELRQRELAQAQASAVGDESGPRTLADVLREAKQNTRRRTR